MSIDALVEVSRYYGKNPDYVLAGGGNTSWKTGDTLYVKASGFSLAEAAAGSFVEMDRKALALIWEKTYPESDANDRFGSQRESAVLSDMMAAKKNPHDNKRPSVEALLHDMMPFSFVVHLHPALVNGLTCSQQGEEAAREIFGEEMIWIPSANPGYVLANLVKSAMTGYRGRYGKPARIVFLQNHGVFVSADSTDEIKELYGEIISKIGAMVKRKPDFSDELRITGNKEQKPSRLSESIFSIMLILKTLAGSDYESEKAKLPGAAAFMSSAEISALIKDRASFAPVSSAFTPDHIVYSGSEPLFSGAGEEIKRDWKSHVQKTGRNPKIIAVRGLGVFSAAAAEKAANLALDLFKDAVKVAVYAESFGGPRFMTADQTDFINNWEVERFRSNISTK